ncbi:hypothetical protein TR51_05200 [Kitasatospora griseola]|uniref:Uncharacterized protein n=1 Tax=Kitasatospora griseola TaxID=2064 RepID=A0A0D0PWN0_KITGR|nr:hypothetical protein [Kitasatospora griseola]KIQ66844.1 hypothetical protein TR51_05200 [Kitasatospora griseola]
MTGAPALRSPADRRSLLSILTDAGWHSVYSAGALDIEAPGRLAQVRVRAGARPRSQELPITTPRPADGQLSVAPRRLAGPGQPEMLWPVLAERGWCRSPLLTAASSDGG